MIIPGLFLIVEESKLKISSLIILGSISISITILFSCDTNNKKSIYIESDHSGSYHRIIEEEGSSTMILFDTHSDAKYNEQFEKQNSKLIYDYNWISPLLGRQVENVIWVPPVFINKDREEELDREILLKIKKKELASKYKVMDLISLKDQDFNKPVIISLDMDYFIDYDFEKSEQIMKEIFQFIDGLNDLKLITVSISAHYHYKTQGDSFILLMLLENAKDYGYQIEFEPYLMPKMDENTPRQFSIKNIHPALKRYLIENYIDYSTEYKRDKFLELIKKWSDEFKKIENYIDLAKNSIKDEFNNKKYSNLTFISNGDKEQGIFVRLLKDSRQRGCFSFYRKVDDLEQATRLAAINAAFFDNRTTPLEEIELNQNMEIEITLVKEFIQIQDPKDFILGHHTILIVNGAHRALIQPSLIFENRWSKEDYLDAISIKAGLPSYIWRDEETKVFKADSIWYKKSISYRRS